MNKQEPVGYLSEGGAERLVIKKQAHEQIRNFRLFAHDVPLYTTPQRKPLTDEHPLVVFAKECVLGAYKESELGDAARRAIEAAYNIKGKP